MSSLTLPRRGFLRGLVSLPLIGGGVTLIGQPTAAAVPVTTHLLDQYIAFLMREAAETFVERESYRFSDHVATRRSDKREWCRDMHWYEFGGEHPGVDGVVFGAPPSTRAAVVMGAAGVWGGVV